MVRGGLKAGLWAAAGVLFAPAAWAAKPEDGQLGFQPAATAVMQEIHDFHTMLLIIITAISLFVVGLLAAAMLLFNRGVRKTPAKFSHNTLVEIIWTAVPVVILLVIAVPSFRLLYFQDRIPDGEATWKGEVVPTPSVVIKAVGYQWNWGYSYPDHGIDEYLSNMAPPEQTTAELYRLAVDAPVVAPVDATVKVLVTAGDVIHNWAMPAFGIKMDAIPGRVNETWFHVDEPGIFYGQCSELCGVRHAFMPIEVRVVPQNVFDEWVEAAANDPLGGGGEAAMAVVNAYFEQQARGAQVAALENEQALEGL